MAGATTESILARTAHGAGWTIAWRAATRLLGLASTLLLVRLLAPGDFGLIALAAAFAGALEACLTLGVYDQIIRARDPDRALYDTAFTLNLLRGFGVAALVGAAAVPAGAWFGDERLTSVLFALAVSAAASGLTNIGVADFRRDLTFDREFLLLLPPRLISIVLTVGLAFVLRSYWALVAGILANRLGAVAMGYAMHPYRPRLSLAAWRELAGVSFWAWAINMATMLRDQSGSLVVGRMLGPTQVGLYSVGQEIATLPTEEVVGPLHRAVMPGFAATLREPDGLGEARAAYLRILGLAALFTIPAGIGVSAVAGPATAIGLGQAWLEAVPLIAILGLASTLTAFGVIGTALLTAQARLRTVFAANSGAALLRAALLLACVAWLGLPGAAIALAVAMAAENAVLLACSLRALELRPALMLGCVWRPIVAAAAMALVLWWSGLGWTPAPEAAGPAARMLAAAVGLGAATYGACLALLWVASGRRAGAETDLVALARRVLGSLAGRLRRRPALAA